MRTMAQEQEERQKLGDEVYDKLFGENNVE